MLVECDVKALEVVTAFYLSNDPIGKQEIIDKVDIHERNQIAFKLPTRVIAKIFKFKLIYGASAFGFASDPDFTHVSIDDKFWQDVIDSYYNKYKGMAEWHKQLMYTATKTGKIILPNGRFFPFKPNEKGIWPRTQILNYPVQGLGADLVMLGRVYLYYLLKKNNLLHLIKLNNTVHDSIVADCVSGYEETCAKFMKQAIESIPERFYQTWKVKFDLPITCEIKKGLTLGNLEPVIIT